MNYSITLQKLVSIQKLQDHVDSISSKGNLLTKEDMFKQCLFYRVRTLGGQYHIELDSNITPVIHSPRKFAYSIDNNFS